MRCTIAAWSMTLLLTLAGCGSSVTPSPTLAPSPTSTPGSTSAPIHFENTPTSGASAPAQLAAGVYSATWQASADHDCRLFLVLTPVAAPSPGTPPGNIFVDATVRSGTSDIRVASAGMHVFQQVPGPTDCQRLWSVDLIQK